MDIVENANMQSVNGPDNGTIVIDTENNCLLPPVDYHKHKEFYDELADEIIKSSASRKRTPSTLKHIFLVNPKEGFTLDDLDFDDILDKLFGFLWETCRKRDNPPRFKIFGKKIITVEFLKPRRVDYDSLDIANVSLIKKPFKSLYNSVEYLQLTIDKYLKKNNN